GVAADRWRLRWDSSTKSRTVHEHTSTQNFTASDGLSRRDNTVISRLRTGAVQLGAYMVKLYKNRDSCCRHCRDDEETIEHILFDCPLLSVQRAEYLPANPSIVNCLYGNRNQLQLTCKMFRAATRS